MITSEVQRTLVKSPPELWSELSDPEALARHLGELGDIKITRVEPENLVEWEAEGTTGTVEIKASGWGTRVTLTVLRELPEGASIADPSEQAGEHAAAPEIGPEDALEETPEAIEPVIDEPDREIELDGGEAIEAEPVDAGEPEPDQKPAPATEAARRAAGWPSATCEPGGPATETPEALPVWGAQDDDLDLDGPEPLPAAAEPRRGFFARLFRRRRRSELQATTAPQLAGREGLAAEAEEAEHDAPGPLTIEHPPAGLQPPLAGEPEQEPLAEEPEPEPVADETEPEPVAEAPLDAESPDGGEPPVGEHQEQPQAREILEPGVERPASAVAPEHGGPAETEHGGPAEVEHVEAVRTGDTPEPDGGAADLAAELLAAEEVAAEQVEAVLSAALDRLGSAHHRPFSRP